MPELKHLTHLKQLTEAEAKSWKPYVDLFFYGCRLNNLTDNSINNYADRLRHLILFCLERQLDVEAVTRVDLQAFIASMLEAGRLSEATINGRIQAMQRFWNYLVDEGMWTKPNPVHKFKKIRAAKKLKQVIGPEEIQKIVRAIDKNSYTGFRNLTMLLLFWDCMLRRNEVITLTLDRVNLDTGIVKVLGKGRKEREVAMGVKMSKTMYLFLTKWRQNTPGDLVFCTAEGNALDRDNARQIIWRMGQKVGIWLHPHLIRHSACTWFLRNGGSPAIAQRIMGHTSMTMTDLYTHMNSQDIVNAYQKFSPANSIKI